MQWLEDNANKDSIIELQKEREQLLHDYVDGKVDYPKANERLLDINNEIQVLFNVGRGGNCNERVVIRRPRMICVLTENEILTMLRKNPDIWAASLKRGKGYSRLRKSMER